MTADGAQLSKGPTIAFATPSLNHTVCMEYFGSMLGVIAAATGAGYSLSWMSRCGDQFIAKTRSALVEQFLQSDAEFLFFVDDDVGFPPEKVVEFCMRPEPIIAGVYPKKQESPDWPVTLLAEGGELHMNGDLVRATMIPMGFTKIHRSVLEALAGQIGLAPEGAPVRFLEREADGELHHYRAFFNSGVGPDGFWWGEDHTFCQNVMALGYELWVDPNIPFTHRGNKVWRGDLSTTLPTFTEKAAAAYDQQQQAALAAAEPANAEMA